MFCRTFHLGFRLQALGIRLGSLGREGRWQLCLSDIAGLYWRVWVRCQGITRRPIFEALLLVVFPQKPVQSYLGAEDGEQKGEEAVAEFVAPGGVDDEGAGDGEGGDDEEKGDPEHNRT